MRFGADVEQHFALQFNGLHQVTAQFFAIQACLAGPRLCQRVFAPGLGIAAHQRGGRCIQKYRPHAVALGAQGLQLLGHQLQRSAAAGIGGNGHMGGLLLVFQRHKILQQFGRQVVYAEVANVFQRVQGYGFARAGHAGDDHNIHGHS